MGRITLRGVQHHLMDSDFFEQLACGANEACLPFLVVGGHAVNAYGYQRTTVDVDLLVPESTLATWRAFWEARGFDCIHATDAFYQFRVPHRTDRFPVDLMVVSEETFEKLRSRKRSRQVGGATLDVPDPLHLIALKLHALRNQARTEKGKDLLDVIGLIRSCELDIQSVEFQEVLDRYSDERTRHEIDRELHSD